MLLEKSFGFLLLFSGKCELVEEVGMLLSKALEVRNGSLSAIG